MWGGGQGGAGEGGGRYRGGRDGGRAGIEEGGRGGGAVLRGQGGGEVGWASSLSVQPSMHAANTHRTQYPLHGSNSALFSTN